MSDTGLIARSTCAYSYDNYNSIAHEQDKCLNECDISVLPLWYRKILKVQAECLDLYPCVCCVAAGDFIDSSDDFAGLSRCMIVPEYSSSQYNQYTHFQPCGRNKCHPGIQGDGCFTLSSNNVQREKRGVQQLIVVVVVLSLQTRDFRAPHG